MQGLQQGLNASYHRIVGHSLDNKVHFMTKAVNTKGKGGIFLTDLGGNTRLVSLKCAHSICSKTYEFRCNFFLG
jgi:hypothetical protein